MDLFDKVYDTKEVHRNSLNSSSELPEELPPGALAVSYHTQELILPRELKNTHRQAVAPISFIVTSAAGLRETNS
jgi:hypothetical protein